MIRENLEHAVSEALATLSYEAGVFSLEHPVELTHGDYATNVALIVGKRAGKNPKIVAEEIALVISKRLPEGVEKVEVAGIGFINFHLSRDFFSKTIAEIVSSGNTFGANELYRGKQVIAEYTDPNPFKVFHIGHLMSNAVGESIARLYEWSGARVDRANYQGDVGLHIAKTIWAMRRDIANLPKDTDTATVKTAFMGKAYVEGEDAYSTNETAKSEIQEINKKLYEHTDSSLDELYKKGRMWSLDHFEELYQLLGTRFDHYFFESQTAAPGVALVKEYLQKGVFKESDGAVVFPGEEYGLHTRVFINSQGLPTYEAKDLGLVEEKFTLKNWDRSITVTANEQLEYFKVMLKALSFINPTWAEKTTHITHGLLRFASGKMSSRKGNVITGESLIEDMRALVFEKMSERKMSAEQKKLVADQIAVGAIKLAILRQAIGKDVIFDQEKSISFEGDSGPYLQYTTVRAQTLLEKGKAPQDATEIPEEVTVLERILYRFPEIVERSISEHSPHHIVTYLFEVAGAFNAFYAETHVLDGSVFEGYRLSLVGAAHTVLTNGLSILGIKVPAQM
jgi:arginyl-tRNA synthetase